MDKNKKVTKSKTEVKKELNDSKRRKAVSF